MDIDLAKPKPPKGVHFCIVPNADLGGLDSNALLEVAAKNVTKYSEHTPAQDALEGVYPANMETIVDEDEGEIEVSLPQKRPRNSLSAEEKAEANAKKVKNKVSAIEHRNDYWNKKQSQLATPAEVQDVTQLVAQQATEPPPPPNPTPSSTQSSTPGSDNMLLMIQQLILTWLTCMLGPHVVNNCRKVSWISVCRSVCSFCSGELKCPTSKDNSNFIFEFYVLCLRG